MSTLDKILGLQKIYFFLMKDQQDFDEAWGVLGGQVPRLYGGTIFGGYDTLRGVWQGIENEGSGF